MKNIIIAILGILVLLFSIDNFGGVNIFPKNSCESDKCDSTKCKVELPITKQDSHIKSGQSGGGYGISAFEANAYIGGFQKGLKLMNIDSLNSGAFLGKDAIDYLFENDKKATGLVMSFVKSNSKTISLVVTTDTTEKCAVQYNKGDIVFICETFCPKICGCFETPKLSNLYTILYNNMELEQNKK